MDKIRKNDQVIVLTGRDKCKRGTVVRILKEKNAAIVEGVNLIKKHVRPNPQKGDQGGILEKEASIHLSNLAHYNAALGKADKVGFRILEDGRKVRYYKSDNELVEVQIGE